MKNVYTVEQINKYIKNMFAQDFMLHQISIKGEVSNCKYHSSGHIYFSLKDTGGVNIRLPFRNMQNVLELLLQKPERRFRISATFLQEEIRMFS